MAAESPEGRQTVILRAFPAVDSTSQPATLTPGIADAGGFFGFGSPTASPTAVEASCVVNRAHALNAVDDVFVEEVACAPLAPTAASPMPATSRITAATIVVLIRFLP